MVGFIFFFLVAGLSSAGSNGGGIPSTCKRPGQVALTFDQGPGVATGRILDVLQKRNILAAFHVTVDYFRNQTLRAYVRRAALEGHTIGMYVPDYAQGNGNDDDRELYATIAKASNWLSVLTGRQPQYVRFARRQSHLPGGTKRLLDNLGLTVTRPRIEVRDENNKLESIWASLQRGFQNATSASSSFVLKFRDIIPNTAASLDRIVDFVQGQNYTIVPLDVCIPMSDRLAQILQHKHRAIMSTYGSKESQTNKNGAGVARPSALVLLLVLVVLLNCYQ